MPPLLASLGSMIAKVRFTVKSWLGSFTLSKPRPLASQCFTCEESTDPIRVPEGDTMLPFMLMACKMVERCLNASNTV